MFRNKISKTAAKRLTSNNAVSSRHVNTRHVIGSMVPCRVTDLLTVSATSCGPPAATKVFGQRARVSRFIHHCRDSSCVSILATFSVARVVSSQPVATVLRFLPPLSSASSVASTPSRYSGVVLLPTLPLLLRVPLMPSSGLALTPSWRGLPLLLLVP